MDDAAEVGIRGGTQIGTDLATARSAPIPIQPTPDPPSWVFIVYSSKCVKLLGYF